MVREKLGGEFDTAKQAEEALCGAITKRSRAGSTDPWFDWYVDIGGKGYPWNGSCPKNKPRLRD
jgi:hypothetical protein